jgi:hypothetical protein
VRFGRAKQNWISEICPAFRIILPTLKVDVAQAWPMGAANRIRHAE